MTHLERVAAIPEHRRYSRMACTAAIVSSDLLAPYLGYHSLEIYHVFRSDFCLWIQELTDEEERRFGDWFTAFRVYQAERGGY